VLQAMKTKFEADHPNTMSAMAYLSDNLLRQKKYDDAESILREFLAVQVKKRPDWWTIFATRSMLGEVLAKQKKYADAEPLLLQGYQGMKQREKSIPPQDKVRLLEGLERLVQLYDATDKKGKAETWRKKLAETKQRLELSKPNLKP
jgi:predicted Zn-dependent protease